jgi:hypothetical protein
MAITRVGVSSSVIVSAGDVSVSEPTGCADKDLLIVPISFRDTPAFTIPGTWNLIVQLPNGNTVANTGSSRSSLALAYKMRGPSAETGIVFARTLGNAAIGAMAAYRGVDPTTPFDQYVALDGVKTTTPSTSTGVTPARNGALLFMLAAMANNTTASGETAAIDPTAANWTEFFDVGSFAGADVAMALADAIQVTATPTGVFSYTAGTNYVHAIAVAVFNPAVAGNQTITVDPGAAVATGQQVKMALSVAVNAGGAVSAGQQVKLGLAIRIANAVATAIGKVVALQQVIKIGAAAVQATGKVVTLRQAIAVAAGSAIAVGKQVVLTISGAQPSPPAAAEDTLLPKGSRRVLMPVPSSRSLTLLPSVRVLRGS